MRTKTISQARSKAESQESTHESDLTLPSKKDIADESCTDNDLFSTILADMKVICALFNDLESDQRYEGQLAYEALKVNDVAAGVSQTRVTGAASTCSGKT